MKTKRHITLLIIALFTFGSSVHAGSVHKWVDEKGITHYSDHVPNNINNSAERIEIPSTYESTVDQDDYYSILNQWTRMREERLERKKLQLEKAKQKMALKQAQAAAVPQVVYLGEQEERNTRYYPVYPYRFGFKRHGNFVNKRLSGHNLNGFKNTNRGPICKLPRSGKSRYGGSGLTLSIR